MSKKMLIDTAHQEETRVVVIDHKNQIEEFDYETESKRQLKGNIYLAKVTRVEPSLQAAFVEYGGNRHGFLAFSEIHPDYYQVPVADRQVLQEIAAEERRESERLEAQDSGETPSDEEEEAKPAPSVAKADPDVWKVAAERSGQPVTCQDESLWMSAFEKSVQKGDLSDAFVEPETGEENERTEGRPRKRRYAKRYKIQEVIKRRQVMLVQVVKEERGNKGAAVTSYLSLAGRYGVLMPNTNRGGGISRKIANVSDRKRLRTAVSDLNVPDGMGLIIRTAGAQRTKAEIKRDYEYLLRLWENVRELTLKSSAPTLVYEEGSLIKRSIRDLYNKDIDTVIVEGDNGYKEAKAFMKMLIPSHAKNVQPYRNPTPLFQRYQVESHLESMFNPVVQLRSGGYLVINPTEALISIDVNSGRATREHSIEDTALKTNLEAAEEAARQFRLRDLAGLIVIDFIDMEEHRNNRAVERKLKESLKDDRARIQVGRISMFGLLEMSRQRMRAGLHETGTITCPHCEGVGRIRSLETSVLHCLRTIEEEGMRARTATATLKVPTEVGLYLLNNKRGELHRIETHYALHVDIELVHTMGPMESDFVRGESLSRDQVQAVETAIRFDGDYAEVGDEATSEIIEGSIAEESVSDAEIADATEERPKKRRRRRRSASERSEAPDEAASESVGTEADVAEVGVAEADVATTDSEKVSGTEGGAETLSDGEEGSDDDRKPRRRRRGRRGGRRNRRRPEGEGPESENSEGPLEKDRIATTDDNQDTGDLPAEPVVIEISEEPAATKADEEGVETKSEDKPKPKPRTRSKAKAKTKAKPKTKTKTKTKPKTKVEVEENGGADVMVEERPQPEPAKPISVETAQPASDETVKAPQIADATPEAPSAEEKTTKPKTNKRGWWQKKT
jgi:ribonuclease E